MGVSKYIKDTIKRQEHLKAGKNGTRFKVLGLHMADPSLIPNPL